MEVDATVGRKRLEGGRLQAQVAVLMKEVHLSELGEVLLRSH